MTKTPYKAKVGISVGLFIWSIGAIIASIYFSQNGLLWAAYVGPILAFIAFVFSITIMPKTSNNNNSIKIEEKPAQHFISKPSWNYEDDEEEWDDEEKEEEERRREEEEEKEERRREEEDDEEFMMYYEDND